MSSGTLVLSKTYNLPFTTGKNVRVWEFEHFSAVKFYTEKTSTPFYVVVDNYYKKPINGVFYESLNTAFNTASWLNSSFDTLVKLIPDELDPTLSPNMTSLLITLSAAIPMSMEENGVENAFSLIFAQGY